MKRATDTLLVALTRDQITAMLLVMHRQMDTPPRPGTEGREWMLRNLAQALDRLGDAVCQEAGEQ